MVGVVLEPVDSWFFSDGTPSAADSAAQDEVGGVFPPHPPTVVGALRAGLARARGWRGGSWLPDITEVLGDGYGEDSLGPLQFDGPYLVRDGQPLFPAPAHLVAAGDGRLELLRPAAKPVRSDLDEVRLPELTDGSTGRPLPDLTYLPTDSFRQVLQGSPVKPTAAVGRDELWADEQRVGIERCNDRRAVKEGALYLARHVRLQPRVGLGVHVAGLPSEWERYLAGMLLSLGGEARMATCQRWDQLPTLDAELDLILDRGRLSVVALTPLDANARSYLTDRAIPELPGVTVVSACLPRAQRIGGWAEKDRDNRGSRVMRSVLAPGSVLFAEVTDPDRFREAVESAGGRPRLGQFTRWGFGAVALGIW